MASNNDIIINVDGGEDKNSKKRRMSAIDAAIEAAADDDADDNDDAYDDNDNDNDNDINEKKIKKEESDGDKNNINAELPTSTELSKELCKIVDTDHYSRDDCLCTLKKLDKWASTQDSNFLKNFAFHGVIVKVFEFINRILDDDDEEEEEEEESIHNNINNKNDNAIIRRMKCFQYAASIVGNVCVEGKGTSLEIARTAVKYDQLLTLLRVNNEYECCGDDDDDDNDDDKNKNYTSYQLAALKETWIALVNIIGCNGIFGMLKKERTRYVFESGMDIIKGLKKTIIDIPIASEIGEQVFEALNYIMFQTDYVTKNEFKKEKIILHCLNVFKKDDDSTWVYGSEKLIERAINFIDTCYNVKKFGPTPKEYLSIIPLCILGLNEFPTNFNLRNNILQLLTRIICSSKVNKRTIEKTGVLEGIVPLLKLDSIADNEKSKWRDIVTKIVAP